MDHETQRQLKEAFKQALREDREDAAALARAQGERQNAFVIRLLLGVARFGGIMIVLLLLVWLGKWLFG